MRILLIIVLMCGVAGAESKKRYGVSAGMGLPLEPHGQVGVAGGLSAIITQWEDGEDTAPAMQLRGEVLGVWSADAKAFMPNISADLGFSAGPVDFFFTGGAQIFGFAASGEYTLFTPFGFVEKSNIQKFENSYVLWGIDGNLILALRIKKKFLQQLTTVELLRY